MAGPSPLVAPSDPDSLLKDIEDRLKALEQTSTLSVGLVAWCAGAVPNGWLAMDGSTFSATRYGQLAAYLGTTTLPNAAGRVIVSQGPGFSPGATGGEATHLLTTAEMPAHAHTLGVDFSTVDKAWTITGVGSSGYTIPGAASTSTVGGGGAHNNLQPYIVLVAIIKF